MIVATTIQVSEETQSKLLRLAADLQTRMGRRVSYDEAISMLIDQARGSQEAKSEFEKLFGSLKGERLVWTELRRLREEEKRRLERLSKTS